MTTGGPGLAPASPLPTGAWVVVCLGVAVGVEFGCLLVVGLVYGALDSSYAQSVAWALLVWLLLVPPVLLSAFVYVMVFKRIVARRPDRRRRATAFALSPLVALGPLLLAAIFEPNELSSLLWWVVLLGPAPAFGLVVPLPPAGLPAPPSGSTVSCRA